MYPKILAACLSFCLLAGHLTACSKTISETAETTLVIQEGKAEEETTEEVTEFRTETRQEIKFGPMLIGSGEIDDPEELLTEAQKELIYTYMDRYFETMVTLQLPELEELFSRNAPVQKIFHDNAWLYMIGLRDMQEADWHILRYGYYMWILEATQEDDGSVSLVMGERSFLRFRQTPDVKTFYPGIKHNFVLVEEDGRWRIKEHLQGDGIFRNMLRNYDESELEELENAEEIFAQRRELLLGQVAEDMERRERERESAALAAGEDSVEEAGVKDDGVSTGDSERGRDAGSVTVDHPYQREIAAEYAYKHVGIRSDRWYDYSNMGGNCMNFISQCLYISGIPMDLEGSARWKWYGAAFDESASMKGCTRSWINVDHFYQYVSSNRGHGLVADVNADYYSGQIGDLIMMGSPSDWDHIVMITSLVKNEAGETIDYLISSNTTDVRDFPVSAYPSARRTLIRILGWND